MIDGVEMCWVEGEGKKDVRFFTIGTCFFAETILIEK